MLRRRTFLAAPMVIGAERTLAQTADAPIRIGARSAQILHVDHQNKSDVGTAIVRRWFDVEGVDAVSDLPISSAALAARGIAREKRRTLLITGGASSDVTGKACSPFSPQWSEAFRAPSAGGCSMYGEQG